MPKTANGDDYSTFVIRPVDFCMADGGLGDACSLALTNTDAQSALMVDKGWDAYA